MDELFDGRMMKTPKLLIALSALAGVVLVRAIWMAFYYAPVEAQMGFVQKIFYFHVPSAWTMFVATAVLAVANVGYLIKKTDAWDRWGDSSVELALLFGTMMIISGPLWARKAWGVWWVWDVRLTSSL